MSRLKRLKRIRRILGVFFDQGFGYFIKTSQLHKYVPFSNKVKEKVLEEEQTSDPVRLRLAFEKLGPTFVKFGQILSLRPDVLPPDYIAEFEKMQDHARPITYQTAKRVVEQELGKPLGSVFSSFDKKPLASASISQVHKARLKNGRVVVVKIQRPNVEQTFREDLAIMYMIVRHLEKHVAFFKKHRIKEIIDEFKEWTEHEIDFRKEALNSIIMRDNLREKKNLTIPRVYEQYSTNKILVQQYVEGISLTEFAKQHPEKIHNVLVDGFDLVIEMIYRHGFFHADPHPGNILVLKNGKLGLIDFGIVGTFDDHLRKETLRIFKGLLDQDVDEVVKGLQRLSDYNANNKSLSTPEVKRKLKNILDQLYYSRIKNIQIGMILEEVFKLSSQYRISFPIDYVLFAKTIMTLEGIGLRYDPEFSIAYQAKRSLAKVIKAEYSPQRLAKKAARQVRHYSELIESAPDKIMEVFDRIRSGKVNMTINEREVLDLREELEHSSGNLSIGMVTGAIIIGSALVLQTIKEPAYKGYPVVSLIGFGIAFLLTVWLVKRTVFAKLRT